MISRRECISIVFSGLSWTVSTFAFAASAPVLAVIYVGESDGLLSNLSYLRTWLKSFGYIDGDNINIEYWITEQFDRLPTLATEIVQRRPDVIYTIANANAALAAKAATKTIPIVFTVGSDPIKLGLVTSLSHPGGNLTGATFFGIALGPKRLEWLLELVPTAKVVAFLVNRENPTTEPAVKAMSNAAESLGCQLLVVTVSTDEDMTAKFQDIVHSGAQGLLVNNDAYFFAKRRQLVELSAKFRLPAVYFASEFTEIGGLMSYSDDVNETRRQIANYIVRILHGEKPEDLPVLQPAKFDFTINIKAAKLLILHIPESLFVQANKIIE
jgi:putative ABC transport system substrate-binding protein